MSEEPIRLRDDPSSPAELRADLARAAGAPEPDYEVRDGLARLSAAIGALPGGSAPPAAGGAGAGAAASKIGAGVVGAKASVLGSGLFWGLAAGVVGASVIVFAPSEPKSPPNAAVAPVMLTPTASSTAAPAPTAVELAPAVPAETIPSAEPPRVVISARAEVAPAPSAAPAPEPNDALKDEMRDLAALRAEGDPGRALALASAGAQRFPGGVFGVEREAIAIGALARLGRAGEARARAAAFVAAHPTSVYTEQVRRAGGL